MTVLKRSASPTPELASIILDTNVGASTSYPNLRRSKRVKLAIEHTDDTSKVPSVSIASSSTSRKQKAATNAIATTTHAETKVATAQSTSTTKRKGSASPRKKKQAVTQALQIPHPTPTQWREAYDTIKDMRSRILAPVDTMGCSRAQLEETEPANQRFATLVSLMLSSQTKDEVTFAAVSNLREAIGGTLSVDALLKADEGVISEAICKVGFWRRKTQYIQQAAKRLHDDFNSDVPKTVEELCSLPGVGPKMAFLALQDAWKLNAGIGVDVHVHRITNRLGWHKPPTKTPEETRVNLESWLPLELHPEINSLLVGFGQTVCLPIGPRCDTCELSSGLCPSASNVRTRGNRPVIATRSISGPKIEIKLEEEVKIEATETTRQLTQTLPGDIDSE